MGAFAGDAVDIDPHLMLSYDRIPMGEVEIRRASSVTSADGHHLGHVDGFVLDSEQQIAHVVLEHGHLWGRREVIIPASAVDRVETDEVALTPVQGRGRGASVGTRASPAELRARTTHSPSPPPIYTRQGGLFQAPRCAS